MMTQQTAQCIPSLRTWMLGFRRLCCFMLVATTIVWYAVSRKSALDYSSLQPGFPHPISENVAAVGMETTTIHRKGLNEIYDEVIQLGYLMKETEKFPGRKPKINPLQNNLLSDLEVLMEIESRKNENELMVLQKIVTRRILELQNPTDCKAARKLFCVMTIRRGLGCLLHHYSSCLFVALGTNRTMVLDLSSSNYADMESVFQPMSRTCVGGDTSKAVEWRGERSTNPTPDNLSIVKLTISSAVDRHTLFTAFTIPAGILERIRGCHADPEVWWIGQIMKYLTRLKPPAEEIVEKAKTIINFVHPIVGIHVRRTDKITENEYHDVDEYMNHVTNWYDRYVMKRSRNVTRRVYVATDEPSVVTELIKNYPDYVFLHDPLLTNRHSSLLRYMKGELMGTIVDVKLLSQCDYFVGTFSSNLGRLVYELMQANSERAFNSLSLDSPYHFFEGLDHYHQAIANNTPLLTDEIALKEGDLILYKYRPNRSFWGYGENMRTKQLGIYPVHKVRNVLLPAPYPGIP